MTTRVTWFLAVATAAALVLGAFHAKAGAVTPPDQPVLIDTSSAAGSVVASSASATAYPASKAFDGAWSTISSDRWLAYINPNKSDYTGGVTGEMPAYAIYKFNVATKVNMLRIRIPSDSNYAPTDRAPKAWTFLGSNDGTSWTTLDTRSGVTWTAGEVKNFTFENVSRYAYYKFECTEIGGVNDYLQIYELQFLYDAGIVLTDLTTATSGSVSSASGTHGSYPAAKAFDGNKSDTNGRWLSTRNIPDDPSQDGMYLVYHFNTATAVNAIRVWNGSDSAGGWDSSGRAPKAWAFLGSNDGTTWTTLDTQTSETGWAANGESRYYQFANNTAYSYYKFNCTALNDEVSQQDTHLAGYLQLWELEFFYVNTGSPALGIVSLSRTGAATYALSATEDANAADLAWIAGDGASATTNGWQSVAEGGTANWTVSGLATDTTYEISVLSTNENGTAEAATGVVYTGALSFGTTTDADENGLVAGGVTVSRAAADPFPLTVNYSISGSAGTEGTTWAAPVAVTIPAGTSSATLPVVPLLDFDVDEDVTITVTILAGNYELPAPATATLTLRNRAAVKATDFAKKMTLTPSETAHAKIGETAWADFPVLVRLPAEVSALLQSADGTDLFFTDENDASLPFEVETFDPAGTTFVWVKVPSLSSATELTVFFGGAANADNDPTAVWSRYAGVWHFAPSAAGTGTIPDATGHGLDGVTNAANGVISTYAGPFGDTAIQSSVTIQAPDYEPFLSNVAQFCASGWFKAPTQVNSWWTPASKKIGKTSGSYSWNSDLGWYIQLPQVKDKLNFVYTATAQMTIPDATQNWNYFHISSDGSKVRVYLNGSTSAAQTVTYTVKTSGTKYQICPANGCSREYRIRSGAASAAETALEYASMVDTAFFTLGAVEVVDASEQVFDTPTVVRNGNGTYTVTVELLENNGAVGVIYLDGVEATTNIIQAAATPGTFTDTPANLAADATYSFAAYGRNANNTEVTKDGTVAFYNGDLSITTLSNAVERGSVPGAVRISRGDAAHDLVVNLSVGGTAVAGQTYVSLPASVTIPAGVTFIDLSVQPMLDAATASNTTVVVSLASGLYGISQLSAFASVTIDNLVAPSGYNTWIAPSDGLASIGSNWSEGHTPTSSENVLFDGDFSQKNCEWDAAASDTVASWTQTNGYTGTVTIGTVFPEKGAFTVLTVTGDMTLSAGTVTHKAHDSTYKVDTYRLRLDVGGDLTVASGAKITARAKGSYGSRSTGESAYGGSYDGGLSWGSLTEPYGVGSSANDNGTYTCFAGGAIWIEVAGATTLDGTINANGIETAGKWDTHAGSGGAVYLKTATLSGSGKISADCESTGRGSNNRSAAGGRVSVLLTSGELSSFPDANITAVAGNTSYGHVGGVGTVLVRTPQKPNGVLYLRDRSGKYEMYGYRPKPNQLTRIPSGQTWTLDEIVFGANAILEVPTGTTLDLRGGLASVSSTGNTLDETGLIIDGGTLLLPNAATHVVSGKWIFEPTDFALDGNLVVTNGAGVGTMLLYSETSNDVRRCGLSVSGNMHVASGSYLRAVRGGYIATGAATPGGTLASCHGGTRAASTIASRSYDLFFHPRHPGAFGKDNGRVNVGGGAIRLAVGGTLTLDGVAIATPNVAEDRCGAAGSIDITAARLDGAGRIEANGNSRNYQAADSSSAGGGGRVAVRLTGAGETFSDAWVSKINAKGYYSSKITASFSSSAGSVYLQDGRQAEGAGTIIIRNTGDTANNVAVTELPSLKAGGEEDNFRRASLSIEAAARVQLFADVKMSALEMADGTALDLNGHAYTVRTAHVAGKKVAPGTYTAAQMQALGFDGVIDAADGAGGTLSVLGAATALFVK